MPETREEIFGAKSTRDAVNRAAAESLKKDLDFEIPVESVPLPSAGSVYPQNHPLHGRTSIEIKAMTAREEDILMSRALIKQGTVITHLLKSCMIDKNVDPDDMLMGDRNAVMIAIRITGYGPEYHVEANCPDCSERNKIPFNLASMPIKRLDINPVEPGANLFSFKLPVTGKLVNFSFMTGADDKEISTTQERMKKQGFQADTAVTSRLQFAIQSIDGKDDRSLISHFVRNMPARDSLALRQFIDKNEPGVDMKGWMECPVCGEHSQVPIALGASFFWPQL